MLSGYVVYVAREYEAKKGNAHHKQNSVWDTKTKSDSYVGVVCIHHFAYTVLKTMHLLAPGERTRHANLAHPTEVPCLQSGKCKYHPIPAFRPPSKIAQLLVHHSLPRSVNSATRLLVPSTINSVNAHHHASWAFGRTMYLLVLRSPAIHNRV